MGGDDNLRTGEVGAKTTRADGQDTSETDRGDAGTGEQFASAQSRGEGARPGVERARDTQSAELGRM